MAWRVYLSERPIRRIEILPGKPSVLAAWIGSDHITFLDLQTGAKRGDKTLTPPTSTDHANPEWRTFVDGLSAPNGLFLPTVRTNGTTILTSADGSMRLYRTGAIELSHEANRRETKLSIDDDVTDFAAIDMDRSLGLVAALDVKGRLHLYQQHIKVGTYATGLHLEPELRPDLIVAGGGTAIFATDGKQIAVFGATGMVKRRLELHYTMGAMRPSADGRLLVVTDLDAGVIRFYDGELLTPTHQRFGVDLMADTKRIQLMPGPTVPSGALGPVALNTKGVLGFTMGGAICVTSLARFKPLPGIAPVIEDDTDSTQPNPPSPPAKPTPPNSTSTETAKHP